MKNLSTYLLERLTIDQWRPYAEVKRDPRAEVWLSAFWERLKDQPDAKLSRNKHRIYFPFELPSKDLELGDQQDAYQNSLVEIKNSVYQYLSLVLNYDIVKMDYIHGKFKYNIHTQRGDKVREANIGKALKDNPELRDAFASDPLRLTSNLDKKKLMIVFSNHSYDIAGMSADRKWTSCMNAISGSNKHWIKEDIKWGTVVAYLIEDSDLNIENPLGRILVKPYLSDDDEIVYFPEPTIYSPYVGLDGMRDFIEKMCENIYNVVSYLYKLVRVKDDPTMKKPSMEPDTFSREDKKAMKEISKKELKDIIAADEERYKFLLYYDDYFKKNQAYINKKPDHPKGPENRHI